MRNTLRLLGIIALVALIGIGFLACNDGSTDTDNSGSKVAKKTPTEDDFDYFNFTQVGRKENNVWQKKYVLIRPKSGASTGLITYYYDNQTTNGFVPSEPGTYQVTFHVDDTEGWEQADLVAPVFTIVDGSLEHVIEPKFSDFIIEGNGTFKYSGEGRKITVTPLIPGTVDNNTNTYKRSDDPKNGWSAYLFPRDKGTYETEFIYTAPKNQEFTAVNPGYVDKIFSSIDYPEMRITIDDGIEVNEDNYTQYFWITGRNQIQDPASITPNIDGKKELQIVPKLIMGEDYITEFNKPTGHVCYYTGVDCYYPETSTPPWEKGKYAVTLSVKAFGDYAEIKKRPVGYLTIADPSTSATGTPESEDFDYEFSKDWEDPNGDFEAFVYDGKPRGVYITPKTFKSEGKITPYYWSLDISGNPVSYLGPGVYPRDAGDYAVYFFIDKSSGFKAHGTNDPSLPSANNLMVFQKLIIRQAQPKRNEFEVKFNVDVEPSLGGLYEEFPYQNGDWVNITDIDNLEDKLLGVHTYKNINYPVKFKYKGIEINNEDSWLEIYYNGKSELGPDNRAMTDDDGPVDAGTYQVTIAVNSINKNFQGGSSMKVGNLKIEKGEPRKEHYDLSGYRSEYTYTYTFGGADVVETGTPGKGPGLAARPTNLDGPNLKLTYSPTNTDAFVASGEQTKLVFDRDLPAASTGYGFTSISKPETDSWKVSFKVPSNKNWKEATIPLTEVKVNRAYNNINNYQITNNLFHAQSAYNVAGLIGTKSSLVKRSASDNNLPQGGNIKSLTYKNSAYTKSAVPPQMEGKYIVEAEITGNEYYNDHPRTGAPPAETQLENRYDDDAVRAEANNTTKGGPYGLVVNPLIIENMFIFDQWLAGIRDGLSSDDAGIKDQFEKIKNGAGFEAVLVLSTDDDAATPLRFNADNYNTKVGTGNGAPASFTYTMNDLIGPDGIYKDIPLILNFDKAEEGYYTIPNPTGVELTLKTVFDAANETFIRPNAFEGFANVKKVVLPTGEWTFGDSSFKDCSSLTALPNKRPESAEDMIYIEIGDNAFIGSGLTGKLEFTEALTRIGNNAFMDLAGITELVVAEGAFSGMADAIGANAFRYSGPQPGGLVKITLPGGEYGIGGMAFWTESLWDVIIGEDPIITFGIDPDTGARDVFVGDLEEKYDSIYNGGQGEYTRDYNQITGTYKDTWTNQFRPIIPTTSKF